MVAVGGGCAASINESTRAFKITGEKRCFTRVGHCVHLNIHNMVEMDRLTPAGVLCRLLTDTAH